ncbi:MAG: translation initiation factor IF-3 [Verrucomicrobiota bacterium]|nr:translation initiation factor IF-3 [Verrucomicrobiota bacterium]
MSRPFFGRNRRNRGPQTRVNGRIRAREVRVVGSDGKQVGIMPTGKAIDLARKHNLDLVEISPKANPPVCQIVEYGRYKYEKAKKDKETKKTQLINKVKEIQLRPNIDPHDFKFKLDHAIDFLCADMKVKLFLRFRGREMAHKEIGYQTVEKFIHDVADFAVADTKPNMVGRRITVMLNPLPKQKRAANPREAERSQLEEESETLPGSAENVFADIDLPQEKQA